RQVGLFTAIRAFWRCFSLRIWLGFRWSPTKFGLQSRQKARIFVAIPCAGVRVSGESFFLEHFRRGRECNE
ncbi:hypothetical protein, partial [Flavobacterium aurantiibacter]|uniref:hypothetical protein n=1 Tax=Flavobacterium aurantiibacter TaxID=2023067 RepID=UPI001A9C68B8